MYLNTASHPNLLVVERHKIDKTGEGWHRETYVHPFENCEAVEEHLEGVDHDVEVDVYKIAGKLQTEGFDLYEERLVGKRHRLKKEESDK